VTASTPMTALLRPGVVGVARGRRAAGPALVVLEVFAVALEGVRDVLADDQAQDDVLALGRVHVVAQRIGHLPDLGFVAKLGGGIGGLCFFHASRALLGYWQDR